MSEKPAPNWSSAALSEMAALRSENDRLRKALTEVLDTYAEWMKEENTPYDDGSMDRRMYRCSVYEQACTAARAALGEKP